MTGVDNESGPRLRVVTDVVLVEHDEVLRRSLARALLDSGIAVRATATVAGAHAELAMQTPTIVIATTLHGEGDASELAVDLRRRGCRHRVGVIAIETAPEAPDDHGAFDAVMRTPVDATYLCDLVHQLASVVRASAELPEPAAREESS